MSAASLTKNIAVNTVSLALAKLKSQSPNMYAKILIHNFPFSVTRHDLITTHRIRDLQVGQIVTFGSIREIGSPSYILRGAPLLPEGSVQVVATVMEHGRGARKVSMPHRQRKGPRPTKAIKPATTVLRVQEIQINPNFNS